MLNQDNKNPGALINFIILTGCCVVGTLVIILFVIGVESGEPWTTGFLRRLLQHSSLSMGLILIFCAIICWIPFRKKN